MFHPVRGFTASAGASLTYLGKNLNIVPVSNSFDAAFQKGAQVSADTIEIVSGLPGGWEFERFS